MRSPAKVVYTYVCICYVLYCIVLLEYIDVHVLYIKVMLLIKTAKLNYFICEYSETLYYGESNS